MAAATRNQPPVDPNAPAAAAAGNQGNDPYVGMTDEEREMMSLFSRLQFQTDAAKYLVKEQDLNNLEALASLSDEDVTKLMKICRKPGGTIQPPPTAGGRPRAPVPHPGNHISMTAEQHLGLAAFYLKHKTMTSRTYSVEDVTIANVKTIKDFKTELEKRKDPLPETAPKLTKKNKFEWFDLFRDYLNYHTGTVSRRPLAYVVRESFNVKPEGEDKPYESDESDYADFYDEIQNRAPIKKAVNNGNSISIKQDAHFKIDNHKVWALLSKTLEGTTDATYIEQFKAKKDGREAFLHLHKQLLGNQALSNEASEAENALSDTYLDGKTRSFQLEDYIKKHIRQHTILNKLKKYKAYSGIDERSKIRHFLNGITDPQYEPVKAAYATTPTETFDETVTSFRTFAQNQKVTKSNTKRGPKVNISSTATGNRTAKSEGPTPESDGYDPEKNYDKFSIDSSVYYKGNKWTALTKGQRNYLRKKRAENRAARNTKTSKSEHSKLKRKLVRKDAKIAQLTRQVSLIGVGSESDTVTDDSDEEQTAKRMKAAPTKTTKTTRITRKKG